MRRTVACVVAGGLVAALGAMYVWTQLGRRDIPPAETLAKPVLPFSAEETRLNADDGRLLSRSAGSVQVAPGPGALGRVHPLLKEALEVVLAEGSEDVLSTSDIELTAVIREVVRSGQGDGKPASVTIDYPLDESIFPPEIVAPTFLWHEEARRVDTWLFDVAFGNASEHIYVLSPGGPPPAGEIDPECITETNEVYRPTPYQASFESWTPSGQVWAAIKRRSSGQAASVTVLGFRSSEPAKVLSRGRITIATSKDPVGAPIFYRDVPLAPSRSQEGVIKPLSDDAVTLIAWRLRDIAKPQSRLLLTDVPTCTNCHSFSADGGTLGMDLDGPQGDKGAYLIVPVAKQTVIRQEDVISWNSFKDKPEGHKTIGFLSQVSPDGQYVVTTLNEAVYVCNFLDYKFLQVFYPTRGILGYYSRATGEIKALPGADDPKYVHCDAVWSPDGEYLVFARAEAKDPYPENRKLPARANDSAETQIQYGLYRIPFNAGRGGKPEPIAGASHNGMSNNFPKVSPDGKWIVFVKCANGQLMRPDSKLWIVPAGGGTARLMRCNTWRMNSWHSFTPNGRWLVFSSKANTPYTQMFLTHLEEDGDDSPPILVPNSTAANRAVNIPEFVNVPYEELVKMSMPAVDYLRYGLRGVQLAKERMLEEAMVQFDMAVESQPDYLEGHVNAAVVLLEQGRLEEAAARLGKVLERDPKHWHAHSSLGVILARKGMLDEAMGHFETALKLNPNYAEARSNMGRALLQKGMLEEATVHFRVAVKLAPLDPVSRFDLAGLLLKSGSLEETVEHLKRSLEIAPRFTDARLMLGHALGAQGNFEPARAQFRRALQNDSNNPRAINSLAWLLATCPKDEIRDGAGAARLAETACKATGYRDPLLMGTLAAAYAEAGKLSQAVATATDALDLVDPADKVLRQRLLGHLEFYREGKPYRDRASGGT